MLEEADVRPLSHVLGHCLSRETLGQIFVHFQGMKLRKKVFVSADNRTVVATLITIGDLTDLVVVGLRNKTIVLASRLNHDSMQKEIKIAESKVLVTNEIL